MAKVQCRVVRAATCIRMHCQDHNRIASVALGNNDAYFVTFADGYWAFGGIPKSMAEYVRENIRPNDDEIFRQVTFSQDLAEWYLETNKRWWFQSSTLRGLQDKCTQASRGHCGKVFCSRH